MKSAMRTFYDRLLGPSTAGALEQAMFSQRKRAGLRVQHSQLPGGEELMKRTGWKLERIPWCKEGWYVEKEGRAGLHPLLPCGAYYMQEPSAQAVVPILDPQPGELILDVAASPGGKTTHIADRLALAHRTQLTNNIDRKTKIKNENDEKEEEEEEENLFSAGLVVANDAMQSRIGGLLENVERLGACIPVFNSPVEKLSLAWPNLFDAVMVDAPCSGEAMMYKNKEAQRVWAVKKMLRCARLQTELLYHAAEMVRPGGRMVYSTCTFNPFENEHVVLRFLQLQPSFVLEDISPLQQQHESHSIPARGIPEWGRFEWSGESEEPPAIDKLEELKKCWRLWPHEMEGDGHFIAKFRKIGLESGRSGGFHRSSYSHIPLVSGTAKTAWKEFENEWLMKSQGWNNLLESGGKVHDRNGHLYFVPSSLPSSLNLSCVAPGLYLGHLSGGGGGGGNDSDNNNNNNNNSNNSNDKGKKKKRQAQQQQKKNHHHRHHRGGERFLPSVALSRQLLEEDLTENVIPRSKIVDLSANPYDALTFFKGEAIIVTGDNLGVKKEEEEAREKVDEEEEENEEEEEEEENNNVGGGAIAAETVVCTAHGRVLGWGKRKNDVVRVSRYSHLKF